MFEDESDDEISDLTMLEERIEKELNHYKATKLSHRQKKETPLLTWWKSQKVNFPCLFQTVRALLATPATSVPSERIFSEAGYVARARRSRILPENLNKIIFIKKNMKYIPDLSKEQLQDFAADDEIPEIPEIIDLEV